MTARFDPVRFTTIEEQESWFAALAKTVAIDFDATIHPYTDGWVGSVPADEPPIEGAIEFLAQLRSDGYRVVIFSTRCDHPEGLEGVCRWLDKYDVPFDDVTCQKVAAVAYVDDRAVPFLGNWEDVRVRVDGLAKGRSHGGAAVTDEHYLQLKQDHLGTLATRLDELTKRTPGPDRYLLLKVAERLDVLAGNCAEQMMKEGETRWGPWMSKLIDWCGNAGWGDGGERPALILELDGNGNWEIEAQSFYDGHASCSSKDLETTAQEAYERLTSHPERQAEAELKSAAYAVARVTNCSLTEAEDWLTAKREEHQR